jgi:hypothetical protein
MNLVLLFDSISINIFAMQAVWWATMYVVVLVAFVGWPAWFFLASYISWLYDNKQ